MEKLIETYEDDFLRVNYRTFQVWVNKGEIRTSPIRFTILQDLIENTMIPRSKFDLARKTLVVPEGIKWHVSKLRKEIGDTLPFQRIIYVRGFGWRYVPLKENEAIFV